MIRTKCKKTCFQTFRRWLIISCIILFILWLTGAVHRIVTFIYPLVYRNFLLILSIQLSGVLLKGNEGLQDLQTILTIQQLLLLSYFCPYYFLINKGKGWMKSYAVLTWNFMRLAFYMQY
ncbi:hypothetical protein CW304_24605 [Bacillus sp. UFRGS-B20]|nr:hypothetical protein CW304_24605 [Bacillus sp. UFRGS-B20]